MGVGNGGIDWLKNNEADATSNLNSRSGSVRINDITLPSSVSTSSFDILSHLRLKFHSPSRSLSPRPSTQLPPPPAPGSESEEPVIVSGESSQSLPSRETSPSKNLGPKYFVNEDCNRRFPKRWEETYRAMRPFSLLAGTEPISHQ